VPKLIVITALVWLQFGAKGTQVNFGCGHYKQFRCLLIETWQMAQLRCPQFVFCWSACVGWIGKRL